MESNNNFVIQLIFNYKNLPNIITYYEFDINQLDMFETWYNTFDDFYINNIIISRDFITYKLLETKEDMDIAKIFLKMFDRPFDLLEQIEDLNDIFDQFSEEERASTWSNNSNDSVSKDTETINDLINAHISGNLEQVQEILSTTLIQDDIINDLKKKYKKI